MTILLISDIILLVSDFSGGLLMNRKYKKNSSVHLQIVLKKAVKVINSNIGKDFKGKGLTSAQFSVLDVLYSKGEMTISSLIEKVLSTSGNMTDFLKNMERNGWLRRKISSNDRRAYVVGLTEEGKKLFEDILPVHMQEIENVYSVLTDEEKKELIRILKKFKYL